MSLVGTQIPNLGAAAVRKGQDIDENFSLRDLEGKYVLLFFYPLDFTFVCPTELHAFQDSLSDFETKNCEVIGCSVDSVHAHKAWLDMPIEKGGIHGVEYTLLADTTKEIAKAFNVLVEESGVALRGTFLIDKKGIIRHESINDLSLGRNVDEFLRLLEALQFTEEHGEVCPAGWNKGKKSMKPTKEGLTEYFGEKQ